MLHGTRKEGRRVYAWNVTLPLCLASLFVQSISADKHEVAVPDMRKGEMHF